MIALLLLLQAGWTAAPRQPTVGDTIQLERSVQAPPGWRVRAGKLPSGTIAEPLGDPTVVAASSGEWVVRYAVVAWAPGQLTLDMPPLWRLGPDGSADSLSGGTVTFHVASVIPDSVRAPAPQPSLGPLRLDRGSAVPLLAALLLSGGALLILIGWRRRGPRTARDAAALALDPEVPDARWLEIRHAIADKVRHVHVLAVRANGGPEGGGLQLGSVLAGRAELARVRAVVAHASRRARKLREGSLRPRRGGRRGRR